jgi:tetratricopeptide (TPR) repeat protein
VAPGLYDQALEIYRQCGEKGAEATTLLDKGYAFATADRPADAVTYLEEGLLRLDTVAEPRRALAARHNLVVCLNASGRHDEALRRLEELRPSYRQLGDRLNLLRLRWLEGEILESLERTFPAEEALLEAREGFMAREMAWEAALVALDLAALFVRTLRPREVRRIAAEILPVFESRRVGRETVAALIAFHQAAQIEAVSVGMVRELASALRRAR